MKLKIISDGTTVGTKLINEETGEMVNLVQKITYKISLDDFVGHATVSFLNIPVEIVAPTEVEVIEYDNKDFDYKYLKNIEKEIKVIGQGTSTSTKVIDIETNTPLSAVKDFTFEADVSNKKTKSKVTKFKFGKKDYP